MPKPKQNRIIVLQSSYSPSSLVADLNLTMNAEFDTHSTVTTVNTFEDSSTTGNENSEYKMAFSITGSSAIGSLTVGFSGEGDDVGSGISLAKTATSSSDPTASTGTVTPIASPAHYYERLWQQPVLERDTELLENVAGIDVRVEAASGYTVTQTVTSTDPEELILTYVWKDSNGLTLSSGTVSLAARAEPYGDYTLGEITITDDPGSSSRLTGGGGRKALRERLRAAAKELRRLRKERRKAGKDHDHGHGHGHGHGRDR